ncbi:hypothetical protein KAR91_70575 [Candidatus Pacearchaeota archaeon]|nr:hypothetical protein [Candidatus Pacearchaeota archaeon]
MNKFKSTPKDKIFEEFVNELRPFLRKSKRLDYGSADKPNAEKHLSEHTLRGDYKGYEFVIELK